MEKSSRSSRKILKLLPKAASPVTFQSPPLSPVRDTKLRAAIAGGRVLSGHIIPMEARRKPKNGSFDTQEPSSPKVSCIGQIKNRNKIKKIKKKSKRKRVLAPPEELDPALSSLEVKKKKKKKKKKVWGIRNIFWRSKQGNECLEHDDVDDHEVAAVADHGVPSLVQMKRYASGRDALSNFEWRGQSAVGAAVAAVALPPTHHWSHCLDGDAAAAAPSPFDQV